MRKVLKTRYLSLLLVFAFVISFAVTKLDTTKAEVKPGSKGTVVFWGGQFDPADKPFEDFEKKTGYKVSYPVNFVDQSKLFAAIASGNPPDAVFIYNDWIIPLAAQKALRPIDEYMSKAKDISYKEFLPFTLKWGEYKGKHYSLPWDIDFDVLYWNKDLFEQAGLDPDRPPQTWDELKKYIKILTKYDSKGNIVQLGMDLPQWSASQALNTFMYQLGVNWVDPYGKSMALNKNVRKAVDMVIELAKMCGKGIESKKSKDVDFAFEKGNIAMHIDDSVWRPRDAYRNNANLKWDLTLIPAPDTKTKRVTPGYATWALALPSGSKNPQGGFDIIKWFASDVPYQWIVEGFKQNNKTPWPYMIAHKNMYEYVKNTMVPQIANPVIKNALGHKMQILEKNVVFTARQTDFDYGSVVSPIWDKIQTLQISPAQGLAEIDKQLKAGLKEHLKKVAQRNKK
ncbi:ABC transporter substrate-binding protein [Caldicellulosiruptoraceae bacterium PP1]